MNPYKVKEKYYKKHNIMRNDNEGSPLRESDEW